MTVSAVSPLRNAGVQDLPPGARVVRRTGFTIAADGSYAACLAEAAPPEGNSGGGWLPERWTLSGPEPYAVPLPGGQPEEPGTQVLPLSDGRVLINRRVADRYDLALLYPAGSGTGELPLGSLTAAEVKLLPPSPAAGTAFALCCDPDGVATGVWRVHGPGEGPPVLVMTVPGRCTGGVWLDREGRLLALDRELSGRTKAVAADLHTGGVSPLLQITDDSDDRLVLAEPDSGLLLLRSDAAGEVRLGWGVLGSRRPVRFPEALRVPGALLTPVAAQPGQILMPEASVVALRAEVPGGAASLALWRPGERRPHWRATPRGWLGAAGMWLPHDELRLPYADRDAPCGLAAYEPPPSWPEPVAVRSGPAGRGGSALRPGAAVDAGAAGVGDLVDGGAADAGDLVDAGAARPGVARGEGTAGRPDGLPAGAAAAAGGTGALPAEATVAFPAGGTVLVPACAAAEAAVRSAALPAGRRRWSVLPLQQAPLAAARAG